MAGAQAPEAGSGLASLDVPHAAYARLQAEGKSLTYQDGHGEWVRTLAREQPPRDCVSLPVLPNRRCETVSKISVLHWRRTWKIKLR